MDISLYNKTALLEACLFASPSFVPVDKLAEFLECTSEEVYALTDKLSEKYLREDCGLALVVKSGTVTLTTKAQLGECVAIFLQTRRYGALSNAAYEVLAISAYNQPVTKTYISQVRGIASSEIVENLVDKGFLKESGHLDLPGRPMGYVTTEKFLTVFNLESLDDLPMTEEMKEAAANAPTLYDVALNEANASSEASAESSEK